MKKITSFYHLLSFAALVSIFLSIWIPAQSAVINPDAICYLRAAELIETNGIKASMHLCTQSKWPFYSLLISLVHEITTLSFQASAYLLNTVFSLISVLSFILIVKTLGGTRRILWWAAFVILLAHEFNSVRDYIVRDHGFFAFYLVSIFALLRYMQAKRLSFALLWNSAIIMATLFRIEGIVFLAFLPLITFFENDRAWKDRITAYFSLNLISIVLFIPLIAMIMFSSHSQYEHIGRLSEISLQFKQGMTWIADRFSQMKMSVAQQVLTKDAASEAGILLSVILMIWYLTQVIGNLSIFYTIAFVYALKKRAVKFTYTQNWILIAYAAINIFITFIFLLEHSFLSKRYLIALSLIFMFWVPFGLERFVVGENKKNRRFFIILMLIFFIATAWTGIFESGASKLYIKQAGYYLDHTVSNKTKLYINDIQVAYYANVDNKNLFKITPEIQLIHNLPAMNAAQYDYFAFRIPYKQKSIEPTLPLRLLQTFQNQRGDRVEIFQKTTG